MIVSAGSIRTTAMTTYGAMVFGGECLWESLAEVIGLGTPHVCTHGYMLLVVGRGSWSEGRVRVAAIRVVWKWDGSGGDGSEG